MAQRHRIIALTILTICISLTGCDNPPPATPPTLPTTTMPTSVSSKFMFFCMTCKKEFELIPEMIAKDEMEMMDPMARPDCPFGGEDCYVVPMQRCPNTDCKQYYVSPAQEWYDLMESGQQPEGDRPDVVCPHCGTDMRKWRKAMRKKRK